MFLVLLMFTDLVMEALSSTEELQVWLRNRSTRLAAIGGDSALRIITNRYRERDGGAAAAELLVSWIRKESPFKKTRVLVFWCAAHSNWWWWWC